MSDRKKPSETPRRSSSTSFSEKKRRERDSLEFEAKKRKTYNKESGTTQPGGEYSPLPGPSNVNTAVIVEESAAKDANFDKLTALLSGLIEKLDRTEEPPPSPETEDGELCELPECVCDPLDDLDDISVVQPDNESEEDADFLKALEDFSGHFHGEEEKGEPLSDRLATILTASLRRRPSQGSVKATLVRK